MPSRSGQSPAPVGEVTEVRAPGRNAGRKYAATLKRLGQPRQSVLSMPEGWETWELWSARKLVASVIFRALALFDSDKPLRPVVALSVSPGSSRALSRSPDADRTHTGGAFEYAPDPHADRPRLARGRQSGRVVFSDCRAGSCTNRGVRAVVGCRELFCTVECFTVGGRRLGCCARLAHERSGCPGAPRHVGIGAEGRVRIGPTGDRVPWEDGDGPTWRESHGAPAAATHGGRR